MKIEPQRGPQSQFLQSEADIAIYGGGAGGGKTWALLLEGLRHVKTPGFSAVIFRRTTPEIAAPGGLWDQSMKLYPHARGLASRHALRRSFPTAGVTSTIRMSHLETEDDRLAWAGAEVALIAF